MASKGRAFYHSRIFNLSYFHPLSYFQYAFPATDYMLCRKAPTGHQHIFLLSTTLIFRPVEARLGVGRAVSPFKRTEPNVEQQASLYVGSVLAPSKIIT